MLLSILKFEQQQAQQRFLRHARNNHLDLADLLIASSARQQGCNHVLTFDKKAVQSELFTSLQ
jgi:predicted nucleic-acid-binding protein